MESTLSIERKELQAEIGAYLGYGRGSDFDDVEWTTAQQSNIDSVMKSAQRRFYFPRPGDMNGTIYEWSFLKPTLELTLVSGEQTVKLPDDFCGIDGMVVVQASAGSGYRPVRPTHEGNLDRMYATCDTATGAPQAMAVRPIKGTALLTGQRDELYVYPIANADYTLKFRYSILPDRMTTTRPFPAGGAMHAETMLASAMAAAELMLDGVKGQRDADFQERLMASIGQDRKLKPAFTGYNGDNSDGAGLFRGPSRFNTVTFDGVEYDG